MATTEAAATVEEGSRKAAGGTMLSSSSGCQLTALEDNAVLVSSPAFTDVQVV